LIHTHKDVKRIQKAFLKTSFQQQKYSSSALNAESKIYEQMSATQNAEQKQN
jgi:hypothetical protein